MNTEHMLASRFKPWLLALGLALTALLCALFKPQPLPEAQARAQVPLEQIFPERFGAWQVDASAGALIRPAFEQARQFQMYDQVLERTYFNAQGQSVMLSAVYGRQQSVGLQMHRPEVCYKAGGFEVHDVRSSTLSWGGRSVPATQMVASMVGRTEPVTYWRLLGHELVGHEADFRWRQLSLGVKGHIPDGLLVRLSSIDTDSAQAHALHAAFARELLQAMSPAQRARVLGP